MQEVSALHLEQKIQLILDKYKSLKQNYDKLTEDNTINLAAIEEYEETMKNQSAKIGELNQEVTALKEDIENYQERCAKYEERINSFESVAKTAYSRINDVLSEMINE